MASGTTTLCVDLGKSICRVALLDDERALAHREAAGLPGVAAPGSAAAISSLVHELAAPMLTGQDAPTSACVGAAGALTDSESAAALALALRDALSVPVAVTSDVITAHVGALGGGPGVTLIAGTGAVALGFDDGGHCRVVDGWGPCVGDLGSGSWIGREGVRAALLASAGLERETALTDTVESFTEGLDPVRWTASSENPTRDLARFAPLVLDLAAREDPVAIGIATRAAELLAATARAAAGADRSESSSDPRGASVAVVGGLTGHTWFRARVLRAIEGAGLRPVAARGDALEGSRLLARRRDLPHERHVHRAQ